MVDDITRVYRVRGKQPFSYLVISDMILIWSIELFT